MPPVDFFRTKEPLAGYVPRDVHAEPPRSDDGNDNNEDGVSDGYDDPDSGPTPGGGRYILHNITVPRGRQKKHAALHALADVWIAHAASSTKPEDYTFWAELNIGMAYAAGMFSGRVIDGSYGNTLD